MPCNVARALGLVAVLMVVAAAPAGAVDYFEARADHVLVMVTGGARRAEELAGDFVRFEQAFRKVAGWEAAGSAAPLVVFGLTGDDARRYLLTAEDRRAGVDPRELDVSRIFALPGGTFVAFSGHKNFLGPVKSAYALYAGQLADSARTHRHPLWYRRGLAMLFSDVEVDSGRNLVRLGGTRLAIPTVGGRASRPHALSLAELLTGDGGAVPDEAMLRDHAWTSWLLMHYVSVARPERRPLLEQYVAAVLGGADATRALAETFGGELGDWERDLTIYRSAARRNDLSVVVAGPSTSAAARLVSAAERLQRLEQLRRIADASP